MTEHNVTKRMMSYQNCMRVVAILLRINSKVLSLYIWMRGYMYVMEDLIKYDIHKENGRPF